MDKYKLSGFYIDRGRNSFEGEIRIYPDGIVSGNVIDYSFGEEESMDIKGHFIPILERDRFVFVQCPHSSDLANVAYLFERQRKGTFEGIYRGMRLTFDSAIQFHRDPQLFNAIFTPENFNLGDEAGMSLVKILE